MPINDRTIPADPEKPHKIAYAIVKATNMPMGRVRRVVAELYGFSSWADLDRAMRGSRDLPDEDAPAEAVRARRDRHREVLSRYFSLSDREIETLAANLAPTTLGDPEFDYSQEGKLFGGVSAKELSQSYKDMAEATGVDVEDALEKIRASNPCHARPWINALRASFGFDLIEEFPERKGPLEHIASTTWNQVAWPIYLSSVRASPGDFDDPIIHAAQKRIAAENERALLLFDHPAIFMVPDRKDPTKASDGVIYGGRILRDGRWSDFVLTAGGMGAVAPQNIRTITQLSRGFISDHTTPDGLNLVVELSKQTAIYPTEDPLIRVGSVRGWTTVMIFDRSQEQMLKHAGMMGFGPR